jgi:hypothetical protein
MTNAADKVAICNIALLSVGQSFIVSLTENSVWSNKLNSIFEKVVEELLADDWYFNRKRVLLSDLTLVYKLTVDTAPAAAAFAVGATLTGATSLKTCAVLEVLSNTVYLVTEPSGDFTDGEVIGDGTNSVNCATGYPEISEVLACGTWDYGYKLPTDQLFIRGVGDADYDKIKYPYSQEGRILLTNQTDDYLFYNKWIGYTGSAAVSDVTLMPLWFHRLISAKLAYILATSITDNMRYRQKAEVEWDRAYLFAKEQNGLSAYSEYEQSNNDWAEGAGRIIGTI